jgi:predicted ATPase
LEPVVGEFRRQFGRIQVDLRQSENRQFVDEFLDTEPNRLGPEFREPLYRHTHGHALFTVEMIRGMQERGDLVQDEAGRWVEGSAVDWQTLPARVDGVIGERIGRLPIRLSELLKVASVEGESFTAEVIAQVLPLDASEIIRLLSAELDRQHRLVMGQSSLHLEPGGQRLSKYRFRHILFQRYLYHSLDEPERGYLHEAIGNTVEQLYGEQTKEVAGELARHFEAAGLPVRAVDYLYQAGERAVHLSANEEAIAHFTKGLELLATLSESPERNQKELNLQMALGAPLMATKGYGAPELKAAFYRARTLSQQAGDKTQLFQVLYGVWAYHHVRAELPLARELAEQMLDLARLQKDPSVQMPAHWAVGNTLYWMGEFVPAQEHLEQSMTLYDPQHHHSHVLLYGQDQGVTCLSFQVWNLWYLGYPDQALTRAREALALARELAHPYSLVYATNWSAQGYLKRREWQAGQKQGEAMISLATEHGFPFWIVVGNILRGCALANQGQVEEGIVLMRQGVDDWRAIGAEVTRSYFLALLADAYGKARQVEEGLTLVTEAQAAVEKTKDAHWAAELHRLKGELLIIQDVNEAEIEQQFHKAIDIARHQRAKSLELRAVMSLSRLWKEQGKQEEARQMLAKIYDWFSEGFDTPDLMEAKALLEELG